MASSPHSAKHTYQYEVEGGLVTGIPADVRSVRLILFSREKKIGASDPADTHPAGIQGGTAEISAFHFTSTLRRNPTAPLSNTLSPKIVQLCLQGKCDAGSTKPLLSMFERWEDLAVASLDLAALANRSEDLAFGTEVGSVHGGSERGPATRRHVIWTNPEAADIGLQLSMGSCAVGRSSMQRFLHLHAPPPEPAPTAPPDTPISPTRGSPNAPPETTIVAPEGDRSATTGTTAPESGGGGGGMSMASFAEGTAGAVTGLAAMTAPPPMPMPVPGGAAAGGLIGEGKLEDVRGGVGGGGGVEGKKAAIPAAAVTAAGGGMGGGLLGPTVEGGGGGGGKGEVGAVQEATGLAAPLEPYDSAVEEMGATAEPSTEPAAPELSPTPTSVSQGPAGGQLSSPQRAAEAATVNPTAPGIQAPEGRGAGMVPNPGEQVSPAATAEAGGAHGDHGEQRGEGGYTGPMAATAVGAAATALAGGHVITPAVNAAERWVSGAISGLEELAVQPAEAAAEAAHRLVEGGTAVVKAPAEAVAGVVSAAADMAKTVVTAPVSAAGAVAKGAADVALGAAEVPVALVTGGPGAAGAAGARALEAPLEAGRAMVAGGAELGAAAAAAPVHLGAAAVRAAADVTEGALTLPVTATKSALQTATGAATALYEAPLEAAKVLGNAMGGGAAAAATAPLRAADAVVHGAVDAVTAAVKAPANLAAAAAKGVVSAGTMAALRVTEAVESATEGAIDAAAGLGPVYGTSAAAKVAAAAGIRAAPQAAVGLFSGDKRDDHSAATATPPAGPADTTATAAEGGGEGLGALLVPAAAATTAGELLPYHQPASGPMTRERQGLGEPLPLSGLVGAAGVGGTIEEAAGGGATEAGNGGSEEGGVVPEEYGGGSKGVESGEGALGEVPQQSVRPTGVLGGIVHGAASTLKAAATTAAVAIGVEPVLAAAERGATSVADSVAAAAAVPIHAAAKAGKAVVGTGAGAVGTVVETLGSVTASAIDVSRAMVTAPVSAAGAVAKGAADVALGAAEVPVALVTGGPGTAGAAGARALEAPLEAGRAMVAGGAELGAAAAAAPVHLGAAAVRAAADVTEGALTLPVTATKSALQTATGAATALYEAPLEAAKVLGNAMGGGAAAAVTAPLRAADAVVHCAVDAVTAAVKALAETAAAAVKGLAEAGTAVVTAPIETAGAVLSSVVDATAAAAKAPVHAAAALARGAAVGVGAHVRTSGGVEGAAHGLLALPAWALRTTAKALLGAAGVVLMIMGLGAGVTGAMFYGIWTAFSSTLQWALRAAGVSQRAPPFDARPLKPPGLMQRVWRDVEGTVSWVTEVALGAGLASVAAIGGTRALMDQWLTDEHSPLIDLMRPELEQERGRVTRHHHGPHHALAPATAAAAGAAALAAATHKDRRAVRGGDTSGGESTEITDEEDEFSHKVRAYHEQVQGIRHTPPPSPHLRQRLAAVKGSLGAGAAAAGTLAARGAHMAEGVVEGGAATALLLGAVPTGGTAAAAGTAAGAYGAYAGTRAAVHGTRAVARMGSSLLDQAVAALQHAVSVSADVAERAWSTLLAVLLAASHVAGHQSDRLSRWVAGQVAAAAAIPADALAYSRQSVVERRLGSRGAGGLVVVPGPAKHLLFASANRALSAQAAGGPSSITSGRVSPSEASGGGGGGSILSYLFMPLAIYVALWATAADIWAWRIRQVLVHLWYITIGRRTEMTPSHRRRRHDRVDRPLTPAAPLAAVAAGTAHVPPYPVTGTAQPPPITVAYPGITDPEPINPDAMAAGDRFAGPAAAFATALGALGTATRGAVKAPPSAAALVPAAPSAEPQHHRRSPAHDDLPFEPREHDESKYDKSAPYGTTLMGRDRERERSVQMGGEEPTAADEHGGYDGGTEQTEPKSQKTHFHFPLFHRKHKGAAAAAPAAGGGAGDDNDDDSRELRRSDAATRSTALVPPPLHQEASELLQQQQEQQQQLYPAGPAETGGEAPHGQFTGYLSSMPYEERAPPQQQHEGGGSITGVTGLVSKITGGGGGGKAVAGCGERLVGTDANEGIAGRAY